jgi:tetraacyldisaccharide 4'-kinase
VILLRPLSRIYGAAVAMEDALYERDILKAQRLHSPVVSVGNLRAGGTGKTPFVIALAQALIARGHSCDVLSRGHGRRSRGVRAVDPRGTAEEFGDEPLLIAQKTGAPVYVGESRYAAGAMAEREHAQSLPAAWGREMHRQMLKHSVLEPRIHILDDGFQHRSLERDFDIVMLSPTDATDRLLPEGRLRAPLTALRRADAVVISGNCAVPETAREKAVWRVERTVEVPRSIERPVAFCGIARPERFFDDLRTAGVAPSYSFAFRDHQAFGESEITQLLRWRDANHAEGFVTTEKDLVRLGAAADRLAPVAAVAMRYRIVDEERVIAAVLSTMAARRGRS